MHGSKKTSLKGLLLRKPLQHEQNVTPQILYNLGFARGQGKQLILVENMHKRRWWSIDPSRTTHFRTCLQCQRVRHLVG